MDKESRFIYRSFLVYNINNYEIGYNTSTAFYIDLVERKAKPLPDEIKHFPSFDHIIPTAHNSKIKKVKNPD